MSYGLLYRNILWPTYERLRGRYAQQLWKLAEQRQWLSADELRCFQQNEVTKILQHANIHCRWYQEYFKRVGLNSNQVQTLDDFQRLPLLTKSDIRQSREEMLATNYRRQVYEHKTGGSSGVPLQFYVSRNSYEWRWAVTSRGYGWAGALDGEKIFYLWSAPVGRQSLLKRAKSATQYAILRRKYYNNFRLSKSSLPHCLESLNRFAPRVLVGYTTMLEYLARYIKLHGGLRIKLQSVITAAETVTPAQRELLREVFQVPVLASYGSREFMLIAMECEHGGMHISADNLLVECLRDGIPATPGELGQVVITDLHNYGMPFIRYQIGDVATIRAGQCPCGRGLPMLQDVHGRLPDTIQTPDGKLISGIFFPHLLKEFDWIEQFQVIQKELDKLHVKLIAPDRRAAEQGLSQLRQEILAVTGKDMQIEVVFVEDIPRTATGKHRSVISEIPVFI